MTSAEFLAVVLPSEGFGLYCAVELTKKKEHVYAAKIEELIYQLKVNYTIIIVTHNMQQAARVSDNTAFFYMGELIEFDETKKMFTTPEKKQTEDYITGRFG